MGRSVCAAYGLFGTRRFLHRVRLAWGNPWVAPLSVATRRICADELSRFTRGGTDSPLPIGDGESPRVSMKRGAI